MMLVEDNRRLLETGVGEDCFYYRKYLIGGDISMRGAGLNGLIKEKGYGIGDFLRGVYIRLA